MPTNRSFEKAKDYTLDEVKEILEVKILPHKENDNYFKNIIGNKAVIDYLKEIVELFKAGSASIEILGSIFHPSFVLLGIEGIGKTLTTFAFANEMELPIIVISADKLLQDYSARMFKGIKDLIKNTGKCVVLFKEIQFIAQLTNEKGIPVYTRLVKLKNDFPDSFFFVSASQTTTYPSFFMGEDGFDTMLSFNPPDPLEREKLIRRFLKELPYVEDLDIPKIARDFFGFSGGDIRNMLKKSFIQATIQGKDELTYEIINQTMYSELFGSKVRKMAAKEVRYAAYHEAGHVIAGYYGSPDYKISKVEVVHRSYSLGLTDPEVDDEKLTTTREDMLGQIRHSLGGKCAEQIIFKTSTTGVMQDLQQATAIADGYVCKFGMDETFGPVFVDDDEYFSDSLKSIADIKMQELMIRLESETTQILLEHKDTLIELAEELAKKETLYKEEIMAILNKNSKSTKSKKSRTKKTV